MISTENKDDTEGEQANRHALKNFDDILQAITALHILLLTSARSGAEFDAVFSTFSEVMDKAIGKKIDAAISAEKSSAVSEPTG